MEQVKFISMNFSHATLRQVLEVNLELERERLSKETRPEFIRAIELHIRSIETRLAFDLNGFINQLN
jgi:hypothetical protein